MQKYTTKSYLNKKTLSFLTIQFAAIAVDRSVKKDL